MSSLAWLDAATDVSVFPIERPCIFRIGANIAHQLASQVANGSEHAAGDDLALNPSKPDLDLIQPGRIGGREVEMHVGVFVQEPLNLGGLVCRQVVQDDVDFLLRFARTDYLTQESHELLAGVPCGRLALDLACPHIQRCVERKRNVTIVFETVRSIRPGDNTGSSRSRA